MANPSQRRSKRSDRDIDISTSNAQPKFGWRGNAIVWTGVLLLFGLTYYLEFSPWVLFFLIPAALVVCVGWLAWSIVVKRGVFTWMRLATKPTKLMAQGNANAAEKACARAIERARRFGPDDHRRAIMLCELAMFVKNQGRQTEALALYEESVGILAKHLAREPFDYFVGLNNYGICFIHLKDFESAQRILEKAIDMTLAARKREADRFVMMPLQQVQMLEFVLRLNLSFLFMEMRELREAELQLREADALEPLLSKKAQAGWEDHYVAMCAMWELEVGNYAEAEREIAHARNPEYPACLRLRARLHLAKQQFAEAEELTRRYFDAEKRKGTLHRPDLLNATLDLAEALFGQGKREDALASFLEARSIVNDFALPHDGGWAKSLELWSNRARQMDRMDLANAMEKELAAISTRPSKAIMILEKFRVHLPSAPSEPET